MPQTPILPEVAARVQQRRGRPHVFEQIDPKRTALVVVDMQNYFMEPGAPVEVASARDIVPAINRLAATTRASGGSVAWVQMTHDESDLESWSVFFERLGGPERAQSDLACLKAGSHMHALWPALETKPQDIWAAKRRYSAFLPESSDLAAQLRSRGIDTVVITGTLTNVCCMTSALDAMMMNFRMIMVSDANAGRTEYHHVAALNNIFETFGDVRSTDEVLGLLQAGNKQAQGQMHNQTRAAE